MRLDLVKIASDLACTATWKRGVGRLPMKHFGLVCPATTEHLNTMLPLGKELRNRGHQVTLYGKLDAEKPVCSPSAKV